MRVSELRIGTELLGGRVIVTHLKRKGPMCRVELTSGDVVRNVTLHKGQPIAAVLVAFEAGRATGSYSAMPHKVRASDTKWRGQSGATDGVRATWDSPVVESEKARTGYSGGAEPTVRADKRY